MKAIQIKYFGPKNTKGSRLKLSVQGFPSIYEGRDYALQPYEQAMAMAERFIVENNFPAASGFGEFNGDFYVTIGLDWWRK